MFNMNWIPTLLLILLKVQSLTGKCIFSSQFIDVYVKCISVDEDEVMSFINGTNLWKLEIENSYIYQLEMLPTNSVNNLIIKNSSVKTFLPKELKGVEFLDLSFNEISEVNSLNNTNLRGLTLRHNHIEFLDGSGLCSHWPRATIETLDLSHNCIKNFTELSCTTLYSLNISHNLIERLSNLLVNLDRVEILDLSYNKLKNVNTDEIANLRNLKMLNLSHNNIQSIEYTRDVNPAILCSMYKRPFIPNYPFESREPCNDEYYDLNNGFLDLSYNKLNLSGGIIDNGHFNYYDLKAISFENNDLNDLRFLLSNISRTIRSKSLTFRNNKISETYPFNFKGFTLGKLDLSLNGIESLVPHTFMASEVHELRLDQNNITTINSSHFDGLFGLERLNISFNPLSTIDGSSFKNKYYFRSLSSIDLSHCLLVKIPLGLFKELPLQEIYLSHNRIETIAPHTFPPLKILDLSHNKIKNLPENVFSGLTISVSLCLSYNPIESIEGVFNNTAIRNISLEGISLAKLSEKDVRGLENLKYLDLSNTNITELSNNTFDEFSSLEKLILNFNAIRAIPSNFFSINTKLTSLSIARNPISTIASDSFPHYMNLKYLNLTLFGKLEKKRFSNLMFLKELHIVHSVLTKIPKHSFKGLINLDTLNFENTTVQYVEPGAFIGLNGLVNFDARSLFVNVTTLKSEIFVGLKALKSLNFSSIGLEMIEAGAFYGLDSLVNLTLSHNRIEELPWNAFVGLKKLKMLDLSFNYLTGKEFTFPFGIFKDLVELTHLHLQHNRIMNFQEGEFSNLGNLRFLNVSHNQLENLYGYVFFTLRNLEVLDLNSNHVRYLDYNFSLKYLPPLKSIGISENKWGCYKLLLMLKHFEQLGINYREISRQDFEVKNIEGIGCIS